MRFPLQHHFPNASRLVLGCMGLGGGWNSEPLSERDIAQAAAAVDAALAAGIALFDHADIYTHGKAEQAFGELLRRQPSLRERLLLQSKCGIRLAQGDYNLSAEHIERSVEASLRRLHTEQLDLLLLHRPDALLEQDEVARAFDRLERSGKVRYFGVSNFHAAQLSGLQSVLPMPLVANQLQMSLLHAHWLEAGATFNDAQQAASLPWLGTLEHCQQQSIQLQAWGPLDRGRLCDASAADAPPAAALVARLAAQQGVAPEALVIAWLLRHPAGIQPVIGSANPARIKACAQALQVKLTREEWYALWVAARGSGPAMKKLDLALQGGGSHGAFSWGVLDALLEDGRFRFDGVSGTSAGAMNAAVLASGFANGGAGGARTALRRFWTAVGGAGACFGAWPAAPAWQFNRDQWPGFALMESWLKLWSPYQLNPLNLDPLREILRAQLDLDAVRRGPLKLFITATSVRSGQPRVFSGEELSIDALLASACLPQQAQTVVIDGEPFWDGGFSGNPAIWPLVYGTPTHDVLLVQINPRLHEGVPRTAAEIADRVNEITFNASLVAELRAIGFVQKLLAEKRVDAGRYKALRLHRVADEGGLAPFDASSKLNTDPRLLQQLFQLGRAAAERWLVACAGQVGKRSSMDIDAVFLKPR